MQRTATPSTGAGNDADERLLCDLLATDLPASQRASAVRRIVSKHGSLAALVQHQESSPTGSDPDEMVIFRSITLAEALVRRLVEAQMERGNALTSPRETGDYLKLCLKHRRREVFLCLFLDTRHRVIASRELFQGSIDGASVHPRVVAEHALRFNAAAVIVAHNHPSGVAEPSLADQAITRRLKDALELLEIRLLDHFIIGDDRPVSLAERGML